METPRRCSGPGADAAARPGRSARPSGRGSARQSLACAPFRARAADALPAGDVAAAAGRRHPRPRSSLPLRAAVTPRRSGRGFPTGRPGAAHTAHATTPHGPAQRTGRADARCHASLQRQPPSESPWRAQDAARWRHRLAAACLEPPQRQGDKRTLRVLSITIGSIENSGQGIGCVGKAAADRSITDAAEGGATLVRTTNEMVLAFRFAAIARVPPLPFLPPDVAGQAR